MKKYSILNDVLGPVMRGPSSSHTAASHRIGLLARELLGSDPAFASIRFRADGSYSQVCRQQGSDLSFASGLMGWSMTDDRFLDALKEAESQGLELSFSVGEVSEDTHPNAVKLDLRNREGEELSILARSTGGGMLEITQIDSWPVLISGENYNFFIIGPGSIENQVTRILAADSFQACRPVRVEREDLILLHFSGKEPLDESVLQELRKLEEVKKVRRTSPVFLIKQGEALFSSVDEMIRIAEQRDVSLGKLAIEYEARLLGLDESEVIAEMGRRYDVMNSSVKRGLSDRTESTTMQLLKRSASKIFKAETSKRLYSGGLHTRAAARAMAVMHVNGEMDLICAAPTAGSAGVLPGVVVSLAEEMDLSRDEVIRALFAASAIGLAILMRGTFAAEEAGCQVEIGAAGSMAAAAVIEAAGGTARQAADAAAISLQNTMGSVCDLVQGIVEIPCHTRNAVAASSAFVCADLVLGGYENPVPLDETIDASISAGRMLPQELRCTAKGGLAVTPSAMSLPRRRQ